MLKTLDLATWITAQSPPNGAQVSMDSWPEDAANVIMVRLTGGLGLEGDGEYLDRPTFSVQFRAGGRTPGATAEEIAWWFDEVWINQDPMFEIGGYRVLGKGRVGGPPSYLFTDDFRRVYRGASYWARIER